MNNSELEKIPLDDLWNLHERICSILEKKIEHETLKLQGRLDQLDGKFGESTYTPPRRPYPKVIAKFQNPDSPFETWSGRGRQPRWVSKLLETGQNIDDFRILRIAEQASASSPGRPK